MQGKRGFTRPRVLSTYQPIRPLQRKGVTRIRPNAANATQSGSPGRACRQGPRITSRWTGVLFSPVSFFLLKNHDRPQLPLRDWSISNLFSFWLPGGLRGTDPWVCCCMYACGWNTATWHVRFFSPSSLVNSTTKKSLLWEGSIDHEDGARACDFSPHLTVCARSRIPIGFLDFAHIDRLCQKLGWGVLCAGLYRKGEGTKTQLIPLTEKERKIEICMGSKVLTYRGKESTNYIEGYRRGRTGSTI